MTDTVGIAIVAVGVSVAGVGLALAEIHRADGCEGRARSALFIASWSLLLSVIATAARIWLKWFGGIS